MVTISKIITIPIYDKKVLLIRADNIKKAKRVFYNKTQVKIDIDNFIGLEGVIDNWEDENNYKRKLFYIILIEDDDIQNILTHECLHLTQDILEYVGIPFQKGKANEAYTYLNSYIIDIVKDKLNI